MSKVVFMIPSVDVVASDEDSGKIAVTILINGNPFGSYVFDSKEALNEFILFMQQVELFEALCEFHKATERANAEAWIKKLLDSYYNEAVEAVRPKPAPASGM